MDLNEVMLRLAPRVTAPDSLTTGVRQLLVDGLTNGRLPVGLEDPDLLHWFQEHRARADILYQEMLKREVVLGPSGPTIRQHRANHRQSGAYYTADLVTRYMARRAGEFLPEARSVIDPACGAGAFLCAAKRYFGDRLEALTGWDLDPLALTLCRAELPGITLTEKDALLSTDADTYDLCLGNPPYISSGLRGAAPHRPERLGALRDRYPQVAEYKLNTYPLFVERGLELIRTGGVLGYILPDSFLTGRYFAHLRRLLLSHTLLELTLIQQDFWEHGRVGQSVILFVRKGPPSLAHRVRVRVCPDPTGLDTTSGADLPVTDVIWGPLQRFRLVLDRETQQFLQQMATGSTLGDWLVTYSGLIARQGQASIVLPPDGPSCTGPVGRLLRSGREVDRYRVEWAGARVCLDPALIKSGGNRRFYEQPKLLLRQTADSLRAAYDDSGLYCLNNIHLLTPALPDTNIRALLGLINSGPLARYYQALTMETGRLYAQVDLDLLESLPIPPLAAETSAVLEELVRTRESAAPEETAQLEGRIDSLVERLYGL